MLHFLLHIKTLFSGKYHVIRTNYTILRVQKQETKQPSNMVGCSLYTMPKAVLTYLMIPESKGLNAVALAQKGI